MADREQTTTSVVAFERRSVAPADPKNLLQVERMLREHREAVGRTYLPTLPAIRSMVTPEARAAQTEHHRQTIQGMLVRAANVPTLEAISDALDVALDAEPDEGAVEVSLAALIDSRMKLPHNLPVFVEAAIFDLVDLNFPPSVVAAACQKLRRDSRFFPEISEIVAACRETLARYQEQRRQVAKALSDRRQAERWLAQLSAPAAEDHADKPPPSKPFDPSSNSGASGWD
ncbi:hypothetical protein [Methylobacterium sp. J-077]|uniref:hypothetical protein n=1 Tax=Methylobacterium sp. J-077 TaxID=2836656 RepID=UPI001FB87416|nr:hypothetical protein [Methylobacterium sp. J-077]MCJ2125114.1 hypothetical protein [Methylobacterium sp. J-077]